MYSARCLLAFTGEEDIEPDELVISIGCTGGRHRSVAISNQIYENLYDKNYNVCIEHRDIKEDVHKGDKKL